MQAGCKMLRDAEGQAAQLLSHWRLQSRNLAAAQAVSREATARADSLQAVSDSRNLPGLIDQVCSLLRQCTMPGCEQWTGMLELMQLSQLVHYPDSFVVSINRPVHDRRMVKRMIYAFH